MSNIYILSQGVELRRKNYQVAVYKEGIKLASYPLTIFENIFIFGNVTIKTSLLNFLISKNKGIVFLDERGFFKGYLLKREDGSNIDKRIKQYEIYFSEEKSLNFMRGIVYSKLSDIEISFGIDLSKEKFNLENTKNRNEILGIEGSASNKMFKSFSNLLKTLNIEFKGRSYKPPKDEINSLLSSIYTLFYNLLIPVLIRNGFDVFLGILHSKRGKHYAFVSDTLEIIRASLTYHIYEYLQYKSLKDIEFVKENNGVYLSRNSLKELIIWLKNEDKIDLHLNTCLDIIKKLIYISGYLERE